jgi:hypothetical protein
MLGKPLQAYRASREACHNGMGEDVSSATDVARRLLDGAPRTAAYGHSLTSSPKGEQQRPCGHEQADVMPPWRRPWSVAWGLRRHLQQQGKLGPQSPG